MHMAIIPAAKRQRNENCWSEASLGDSVRPLTTNENQMYVHEYVWQFILNYRDPLILHTTRGGCFCYLALAALLFWLGFVCLFFSVGVCQCNTGQSLGWREPHWDNTSYRLACRKTYGYNLDWRLMWEDPAYSARCHHNWTGSPGWYKKAG